MNYYEHHLGDYLRDTAHLSMIEDGAYRRLLDAYYIAEAPFPDDKRELMKVCRAVTKPERDAVEYVLKKFFVYEAGSGWLHRRCEREIARFKTKQAKAKASADARWGAQRTQCERNANASSEHDAQDMRTHSERNANGMHRAPVPSHQTPDPIPKTKASASDDSSPPTAERARFDAVGQAQTPAGAVCRAMREKARFTSCNPGDPRLLALLAQGATEDEFVGIAAEAVGGGKGWAWVLTVLQARRKDAQALRLAPPVDGGTGEWHETRGGVEAKAKAMGLAKWDECSAWADYKALVIAAAGKRLEAA